MCIIVAKHFKKTGWVLAKNRDQDYVSDVSFKDEKSKEVEEILLMYDHDTGYREGMNHKGLEIITTSLTPTLLGETNNKDGKNIEKALHMKDPEESANFLVKQKTTGYIFCATPNKLVLVEAARTEQGKGEYQSKIRVIPTSETVVRTNHGIDLPWAWFQNGVNDQQDIWTKSSKMRMEQAEEATKNCKNVKELLEAMATKRTSDLQFNLFRVENKPRQMRTIFQWGLIPSESLVIIRPIQTKLDVKITREKIHMEVLDNEILKKTFSGRIKHFAKIEVKDNGEEIKTVIEQKNNLIRFSDFVNNKNI